MKILRFLVVAALLPSAAPAFSQAGGGILVSAVAGSVELRDTPEAQWKAAAAGAEMREGSSLRTGPDGRAQVTFPDKAVVWVKESTTFDMQSTLPLTRKVKVDAGEVKASVPHLKRNQTFEVHTANAVAAVRGTVFTVGTDANGNLEVKVAFGEVKLHMLAEAKTYSIPQGNFLHREEGVQVKVQLMNKGQETDVLMDWSPGLASDHRNDGLNRKDSDRQQIRNFQSQTEHPQQTIDNLLAQAKNNDFAAGRTLLDKHGNLTRVDQFLIRPHQDDVEFVNLVKRPNGYVGGPNGVDSTVSGIGLANAYTGPATPVADRLDSLTAYVQFGTKTGGAVNLPQNLQEWPSYFSNNDVRPQVANVTMANQTDPANILVLSYQGVWCGNKASGSGGPCGDTSPTNPSGQYGQDTIASDLYLGRANAQTGTPSNTNIRMGDLIEGSDLGNLSLTKFYPDHDIDPNTGRNINSFTQDGSASSVLFANAAAPFCGGGSANGSSCAGATSYVWLASEVNVIDNQGSTKKVDDFTSSGKDPLTLLKETAGEIVVYAKTTTGNAAPTNNDAGTAPNMTSTDYFGSAADKLVGANIDLVIVPDLGLSIAQGMGASLSHLGGSNSSQ